MLCDCKFDLIKLWDFVCGQNALIKQVKDRCLKILHRSAVVDPTVVQNQVHQEQRIPLWPKYGKCRNITVIIDVMLKYLLDRMSLYIHLYTV